MTKKILGGIVQKKLLLSVYADCNIQCELFDIIRGDTKINDPAELAEQIMCISEKIAGQHGEDVNCAAVKAQRDVFLPVVCILQQWELLEEIIEEAKIDRVVFRAVSEYCGDRIRTGKALPKSLTLFVADVLYGRLQPPAQKGKSPYPNDRRDFFFALAVYLLSTKFGIPISKNYGTNKINAKKSCFEIVADAGLKIEKDVTYGVDAVAKAWKKNQKDFKSITPAE
jgi:hypothetical protein